MDIFKILKDAQDKDYRNLYLEDLDFFESELATGSYSRDYRKKTQAMISAARSWMSMGSKPFSYKEKKVIDAADSPLNVEIDDLKPDENNSNDSMLHKYSREQIVAKNLKTMRNHSTYKSDLIEYIKNNSDIDSKFIDENISIFRKIELDTILSVRQMDEDFLEKYFDLFDSETISRYQCFSETFFMKHFGKLDTNVVLKNGCNEWRKKEKRSKKLNTFLRLKGVKI